MSNILFFLIASDIVLICLIVVGIHPKKVAMRFAVQITIG